MAVETFWVSESRRSERSDILHCKSSRYQCPFKRGDRKAGVQGLGLGLYIASQIAQVHHMEQVRILEHDLLEQLPSLSAASDANEKVILRIAANADSLGTWFLDGISDFTKSTNYLVHLSVDDEDYTAEWLQQGKVVAAVSSSEKPIPGCRRFPLGSLRYHATCSPEFSDRFFHHGVTPKTLAVAPCLTFNQKDRLQSEWVEYVFQKKINLPAHWLPSTQSFVDASLMSMGWGMNPALLVDEHLSEGRLIELVPGKTLTVPLYWHISRLAADRISELTRFVSDAASQKLR
ncbi:ArgP/LysG family DNA-binding transcriptional regulator [Neorhizobium vignae]|uniref:ArgP/LysG family DNA-binding transcriptional regulator n=1 Tax=Neorhizobium vignae TaxID=690585 RepID=UPI0012695478|nr:ArgP/LysG family DNA-binding transcriptional regulator [Neorhizobium vignae]